MFEIVLLIAATAGIAAFARGRGGKPWLWGALTVIGYFLVPFFVTFFAVLFGADLKEVKQDAQFWFFISAVTWVALLAFCARFLLGHSYAKPGRLWSCPNCEYLNKPYAIICEACRQPYASKALPF